MTTSSTARRAALSLALAFFALSTASTDQGMRRFPECDRARARWFDYFQGAPVGALLAFKPRIEAGDSGAFALFPVSRGDGAYAVYAAPGSTSTAFAQGSWVVKRELKTGAFAFAKVFLRSDPGVFALIRPSRDERCLLEIDAYGGVLYKDVSIAIPFATVLKSPFADVVAASSSVVDWSLFSPEPELYRSERKLIASIRGAISGLDYADDGAFDERGAPVRISDGTPQPKPYGLNCSGFALWLADGLSFAIDGRRLALSTMRLKRLEERWNSFAEPYEDVLDPYFGLDWTRNLGQAVNAALYPESELKVRDIDVLLSPFSLFADPPETPFSPGGEFEYYPSYFVDAGYQVRGIKAILYRLAIEEPGRFYMGTVSDSDPAAPSLRRYFHIAAFFPYFDDEGRFAVAVFESAEETSLDAFMKRYDDSCFVHLVRFEARPGFAPFAFPAP